jgi:hypothetical protein
MKIFIVSFISIIMVFVLSACNAQLIDTTYYYKTAQVKLPDGTVVTGKVNSWKDYDDSDAVQVVIDGVTYYTFLGNVVLICD